MNPTKTVCELSQIVVYLLRLINMNPTKTVCELSQMVVYLIRLINTNHTKTVCELSQMVVYLLTDHAAVAVGYYIFITMESLVFN
jgi:hypothetical protein